MRAAVIVVALALAACEPSYDGTALRCDDTHGCPSDMGCFGGRCRRKGGAIVQCGATTCAPDQQCCSDIIEGDRCLAANDTCSGDTALCDDPTDCAPIERCCSGPFPLTVCALQCEQDIACIKDADCPGDMMHCCPQTNLPWKACRGISC